MLVKSEYPSKMKEKERPVKESSSIFFAQAGMESTGGHGKIPKSQVVSIGLIVVLSSIALERSLLMTAQDKLKLVK